MSTKREAILGIDIGGSGIKGAPVDVRTGALIGKRYRIPTPQPSTPKAVVKKVKKIAKHFDWDGPLGAAFPAIIKNGVVYSAANVDDSWIGTDGRAMIEKACKCDAELINDADAAGIAEMEFGAGRGQSGSVIVLTFGTGIGSAFFIDGALMPNTELGHIEFRGMEAEHYAADRIRTDEELSWKKWGKRVNRLLNYYDALFNPDLFIIGGGVSKQHDKFFRYITVNADVVPARMRNEAGIIGAALAAKRLL